MFSFFKKAKTFIVPAGFVFDGYKKPERHYIPADKIEDILKSLDAFDAATDKRTAKYSFWKKMEYIFPDLDLDAGGWGIDCGNIFKPYIHKVR